MVRLYNISATEPASVVHFDWMTVVFPVSYTDVLRHGLTVREYIDNVLRKLGLDELLFEDMEHGIYMYDKAAAAGTDSIILGWYTGAGGVLDKEHDNFMLQMSGAGVETLENLLTQSSRVVSDFVSQCLDLGATFSRVDPCCNFFNYPREFSARYVGEEAEKGNLVTRASFVRTVRKFSSRGGKDTLDAYQGASEGFTTYIGKNPKQLRVYNKLAERSDKVNLSYKLKSWSRWEYQLNGKYAQAFIDEYVKRNYDLVQTWVDWLASNYRWIERVGHQAERSRYPNAVWYDELIKTAKDKIVVRSERQKPTFEKSAKWIDRQVMPTMATIYYARVKKYMQNGVTEKDARKLALDKVKADIEDQAVNQNLDWKRIEAYALENFM